jgi:hypothetical protein
MEKIYSENAVYSTDYYEKYRNLYEYRKLFNHAGFKFINIDYRGMINNKFNPTKYCYMCLIKQASPISQQIHTLFGSSNIKYDNIKSLTYVTPHYQAIAMNQWITNKLGTGLTIIESCGGLGGDTIQFYKNGSVIKVISYEIDLERFNAFKYNVDKSHNSKYHANVKLYNENFIPMIINMNKFPDKTVVYFDIPWGGSTYKKLSVIQDLYITYDDKTYGCIELTKLVADRGAMAVIFKLPLNFKIAIFDNLSNKYYLKKGKTLYIMIIIEKIL